MAYWKTKYETAEEKSQELHHRVIKLESERDTLLEQAEAESTAAVTSTTRKRGIAKQQATTRTSKRVKASQANATDAHGLDHRGTVPNDRNLTDGLGEAGTGLSQYLYVIHKLYKSDRVDVGLLTSNLVQTARSIGLLVSKATVNHIQDFAPASEAKHTSVYESMIRSKEKMDLPATIRASARAFTSLLVGLDKISVKDESRSSNIVIYECVKMFQSILGSISKSARSFAECQMPSNSGPSSNANSSARRRTMKETKEADPSRVLVQFINALISYLDRKNPFHRELFEGFFFVLLERIGELLYYCTFNCERSRTVEGDILKSITREDAVPASKHEMQIQAIHREVPSLIAILERAIALAPYHLNSRPASSNFKIAKTAPLSRSAMMNPNLPGGKKAPLSDRAKDRLQRTLVNCLFGEDKPDEFSDCLRMPARLGGLPAPQKMDEKDVGEWFQSEVWRLVGWNLLAMEGQW